MLNTQEHGQITHVHREREAKQSIIVYPVFDFDFS